MYCCVVNCWKQFINKSTQCVYETTFIALPCNNFVNFSIISIDRAVTSVVLFSLPKIPRWGSGGVRLVKYIMLVEFLVVHLAFTKPINSL